MGMRSRRVRARGASGTITLTVRSARMEHYRSTLATTAFAVFGLVAAAHIFHPGNYEAQPRPVRVPVAIATATPAWVDPPADMRVAAVPNRTADTPGTSETSGLLAPRAMATLPPGEMTAPMIPSAMASQPGRGRKIAATQRRKIAQRTTRTRQASLDRGTVAEQPSALNASAAEPKAKIDPIGDLIRGLGLGGEG